MARDGGALLLREVDRVTATLKRAAACFKDCRHPSFVEHDFEVMLRQRMFGLCLGYEDLNDHDALQDGSLLALACGRVDNHGSDRRREEDRGKPSAR